ncbi:MAG TPA: hypothetical protein VFB52_02280 [Solirubrobacterales bacterium]|nr:hypothetical protein [Solirubrobacterales bacterium]
MTKSAILSRERAWFTRVGVAGILGGILALVGFVLLQSAIGGDANFESLTEAKDNSSNVWIAGVLTGVGYLLVAAPLYFLFRAAQARSDRVKNQMVGLVLLGPLLLGISAPLISGGTQEAADSYIAGSVKPDKTTAEIKEECEEDKTDKSAEDFSKDFPEVDGKTGLAACEDKKTEESKASQAIKDSTLLKIGQFAGLAGGLSLVVGLLYVGLWTMRTGLLSRFWGSLGMAVGFASIIGFSPLTFIWFIFVGLLLAGFLPGGRPPAWDAGEAVPWPSPGEKAAAEMEPDDDAEVVDVDSEEIDETEIPTNGKRKRKRRSE